jgi:hypothetical protein
MIPAVPRFASSLVLAVALVFGVLVPEPAFMAGVCVEHPLVLVS